MKQLTKIVSIIGGVLASIFSAGGCAKTCSPVSDLPSCGDEYREIYGPPEMMGMPSEDEALPEDPGAEPAPIYGVEPVEPAEPEAEPLPEVNPEQMATPYYGMRRSDARDAFDENEQFKSSQEKREDFSGQMVAYYGPAPVRPNAGNGEDDAPTEDEVFEQLKRAKDAKRLKPVYGAPYQYRKNKS